MNTFKIAEDSFKLVKAPCQVVDYHPKNSGVCAGCAFDYCDRDGEMVCTIPTCVDSGEYYNEDEAEHLPESLRYKCVDKETKTHYIWVMIDDSDCKLTKDGL